MKAHQGSSHAGGPRMGAARWHMRIWVKKLGSLYASNQGPITDREQQVKT